MKTRWKISIAAVTFVGLSLGVSLLTMHVGSENELAAYKKTLSDQGVKLQISEVLPPPVPAGQNGADLVEAAFKILPEEQYDNYYSFREDPNNPPTMQLVAPGKAMVGWQQPLIVDGCTNYWENVGQVVEMARPAVKLLQEAARFPALDFHPAYEKGLRKILCHI